MTVVNSSTMTEKWGWKELASTIVDDHHRDGQSATFVFSGARLGIYMGALGVRDSEAHPSTLTVVGEKLSKRELRKYFWENFAGMDSPADATTSMVIWSAFDEDKNESYVGIGDIIRQSEDE